MRPDPTHPDAQICPRCGYANAATVSACRLCTARLPERPHIATPVPPDPEPAPEITLPLDPPPLDPVPPLDLPSPATLRRERWRALADGGARLARALVVPLLSAILALQRRIKAVSQRTPRRPRRDPLRRPKPRPYRARPSIAAAASRMAAQALGGLWALTLLLGRKARALQPRLPSWKLRLTFRVPRLDLRPALTLGRRAFSLLKQFGAFLAQLGGFLARLVGLALKAFLAALRFLLEQSRKLPKLRGRFPAVKLTISADLRRATRYGGSALASLLVVIISGMICLTVYRSLASRRIIKSPASDVRIEEDYQRASRKTLVKLEPLPVPGRQSDGLSISASFSYSGRKLKRAPARITLSLTVMAREFKDARQRALTALADGETIKLGVMNRAGQRVGMRSDGSREVVTPGKIVASRGDHMLETLTLNVPTATLTKIAQSQTVKMKLGETEFDLTATHLAALRDVLARAAF
jgi:hypothetical protein